MIHGLQKSRHKDNMGLEKGPWWNRKSSNGFLDMLKGKKYQLLRQKSFDGKEKNLLDGKEKTTNDVTWCMEKDQLLHEVKILDKKIVNQEIRFLDLLDDKTTNALLYGTWLAAN